MKARVHDCHQLGVLDVLADQPVDRTRVGQRLDDESFWLAPIGDPYRRAEDEAANLLRSDTPEHFTD